MPLISEFPIAGPQGKQGPVGPEGKQGPEGKRGPMGPAGPGTGDMLAMVYDPQGKAIDVYKYMDDAVAGRADLTLSNLSNRQKALRNIGGRPNRNLLDNWYFAGGGSQQGGGQFPINQRGETSYSGNQNMIDRWKGIDGSSLSLNSNFITITGTLRHFFEHPTVFSNKTVTVSSLVQGTGTVRLNIYSQELSKNYYRDFALTGDIQLISTTQNIENLSTNIYTLDFMFQNTINLNVYATKLELGPTQTLAYQDKDGNWQLFETPDYAEELAKCQRYYEQTYWSVFYAVANSASQIDYAGSLVFSVQKRIAPTSTVNPNPLQNLSVQDASNGFTPVSGCALQIPTAYNRNMIAPRVTGNFTIGHIYRITIPDNAYIISAEL